MQRHGPWQIIAQRQVYSDPWTRVCKDEVIRPDGRPGTYTVVHVKPGVSVLAMDDQWNVHLTEEFHYGVGRTTVETVSGGIEPGEDALTTAQRELREELGILANIWTDLGIYDPFTANVVSPTHLFLARDLTFGRQSLEGTEQIRRVSIPLDEAVARVMASHITHAPSCLAILKTRLIIDAQPRET